VEHSWVDILVVVVVVVDHRVGSDKDSTVLAELVVADRSDYLLCELAVAAVLAQEVDTLLQ